MVTVLVKTFPQGNVRTLLIQSPVLEQRVLKIMREKYCKWAVCIKLYRNSNEYYYEGSVKNTRRG